MRYELRGASYEILATSYELRDAQDVKKMVPIPTLIIPSSPI